MKKILNKYKGQIILLLCAILWGSTFVAQKLGSDNIGPYAYTSFRFLTSGIILGILFLIMKPSLIKKNEYSKPTKKTYFLAIVTGVALSLGAILQQIGLNLTNTDPFAASKSGFITSLYIIIVPLIGVFFKQKLKLNVIFSLFIALIGAYLIASKDGLHLQPGDICTLICALFFAIQIILIDITVKQMHSIQLCSIEFLVTGVISLFMMLIFEKNTHIIQIKNALFAIMYAAIISGCFAYSFQVIGQKYTEPTTASLIMSLESVFALIFSIIFLGEGKGLSLRAGIGCILVFTAVILSQISFNNKKENIHN